MPSGSAGDRRHGQRIGTLRRNPVRQRGRGDRCRPQQRPCDKRRFHDRLAR
ncbi:hypothetical protein RSPO_c01132 [Ralstonia solanacearum Po82]|uniref:Uncharacterized protein n=1 Tax=Ralstonia solanacearum (strain Po82) TaxID=1031711 RepID=F6FZS0_RALS8|nr:hypothetical protein RSPO_c01132 [Ralstonia solanacearum Po82]